MNKVIIENGINIPPREKVDQEIQKLGDEWKVVSANTTATVFGIVPDSGSPPLHHCVYTTTVVLEPTTRKLPLGI